MDSFPAPKTLVDYFYNFTNKMFTTERSEYNLIFL